MYKLIKVLSIALVLAILSGCGSGAGSPSTGGTSDNANTAGCPVGEWFATNGYNDYITVGNDGMFTMRDKGGAMATGFVTCTDGQKFIMNIESGGQTVNICNSQGSGCHDIYESQKPGIWQCRYSVSKNLVQVYCPDGDLSTGNVFNPARVYYK